MSISLGFQPSMIEIPESSTKVEIRPGKGQVHPICICKYNIDITSGGCPIALEKGGEYISDNACSYCYAKYVHRKYVKNKIVNEKVWDNRVPDMEFRVIRIGKMTEPGGRESRNTLHKVLKLNNHHKIRSILITKLLEWDRKVSDLLLEHDSTIHFSMGCEELEKGAIERGATNKLRLETALKYHKAKNNVYLRVVADVTDGQSTEILKWSKTGIPLLVTPVRFFKKDLVPYFINDETWNSLKANGRYVYKEGALSPSRIHKDWTPFKERCGFIGNKFHCNNCGLGKVT